MSYPKMPSPPFEWSLPIAVVRTASAEDRQPEETVLQLFDECAPRLRRYVLSFGLPPIVAEDVVQDVFLSLFRHLRLGRSRAHLHGWLYRVAHNLALKERRHANRWATTDADDTFSVPRVDDSLDPEEQLVDVQRRRRLRAVARALPERDRRCLYLRAEGLTYREIADVLGVSLGAVAKSLARAMARLTNSEAC